MDLCNDRLAPPQAAGMNLHVDAAGRWCGARPADNRNALRRDRPHSYASPRRASGRHTPRKDHAEERSRTLRTDPAAQHRAALVVGDS
jgi:hypothetical protein